jgi:hypothetical protein
MDGPVTRREMHQTLELWGKALFDKMEALVASSERRLVAAMSMLEVRLTSAMHDVEARLSADLARGTHASEEELTSRGQRTR